jgi:hypothetical protein
MSSDPPAPEPTPGAPALVVGAVAAPDGVRFEQTIDARGVEVCRLVAERDLRGVANGWFTAPVASVSVSFPGPDVEFLGFAFTQFALPVLAGADAAFDFTPAPNLHSPSALLPLLARDADGCVLLAPLNHPHEQIITVADGGLRWGWHGDLDEIDAGFVTDLGVFRGATPTEVFDRWGSEMRARAGVPRPARGDNPLTSHLSYWTDNGAAYWYRTEPGRSIADSVATAVEGLRAEGVPVVGVELDSWFYPHATNRPIAEIGYPEEVPPTGMDTWTPRPDAFAPLATSDGVAGFADRLGRPPLILHSRHIDPTSSYVDDPDGAPAGWWVEELAAQPIDPEFFRRWFDDAAGWGATCIEQDWMLMYWFGLRALRQVPGRAMAWQRALNEHARATGVDLMWCMATPADLIAAVELDRVIAVRTSDDYRFAADPAFLWTWFLTVNRMVTPLGLWPFKDCFFSNPDLGDGDDPIDGDRHAELEALLSAMSGGPVGIGDRIGRTDRDIVMRTCADDGRILQPDRPIGMIDDCLFGSPARGERLAWATAATTIGDLTWTYVVAINTAADARTVADSLTIGEIGLGGDGDRYEIYDWRAGTTQRTERIDVELAPRDWSLHVCCPIVDGTARVGDPSKYVTAADLVVEVSAW